ncbi:MAG: patatin family protein [Oscillospiraceae bacterium]|nr:patatin family protein [Oscillospiraceae bacterium]
MKIGLVIEGGASRTYFACGVMDWLLQNGIHADYIIGVSAGIAFGVSYCSRQFERNLRILKNYEEDKRYMGVRHLLDRRNKSYYNLEFVFETIPKELVPFDYPAFYGRKERCIAVVTRLDSGEAEYIEMPVDDNFDVLKASCALPILFKPIELNGVQYMDGGIADSIPFKKALDDGCDKVIVLLSHPRGYIKGKESAAPLVKMAYRKHKKFLNSFQNRPQKYNESLRELEKSEKEGKALVLAPTEKELKGIGRTEKKVSLLEPLYRSGFGAAERLSEQIREFVER